MNLNAAKTNPGLVVLAFGDNFEEKAELAIQAYSTKKGVEEPWFRPAGLDRRIIKDLIPQDFKSHQLPVINNSKFTIDTNGNITHIDGVELAAPISIINSGGASGGLGVSKSVSLNNLVASSGSGGSSGGNGGSSLLYAGAHTGRITTTKPLEVGEKKYIRKYTEDYTPPRKSGRIKFKVANLCDEQELPWMDMGDEGIARHNPNIVTKSDIKNALASGLSIDEVNAKLPIGVSLSDGRKSSDGKEIITGDTVEGDDKPQTPDNEKAYVTYFDDRNRYLVSCRIEDVPPGNTYKDKNGTTWFKH
jgi:hypothetical protein